MGGQAGRRVGRQGWRVSRQSGRLVGEQGAAGRPGLGVFLAHLSLMVCSWARTASSSPWHTSAPAGRARAFANHACRVAVAAAYV